MGFQLSGLTEYVDEHKLPLIKKTVLGARTLDYINVQADIKHSASINIIDGDLVIQAGSCSFNANGTTELTQRLITVCPLKVNEAYCPEDLDKYYTQTSLKPGSYIEDFGSLEGAYAELKADKIADEIDAIIWKGDTDLTGSTVGNLDKCDGFIKLLDGAAPVDGKGAYTGITALNVMEIVDYQVSLIPTDILDANDLIMFVGYDVYRMYTAALRKANMYHYTGDDSQDGFFSIFVPGTNVRIVAIKPLNGTGVLVTTREANLYFGTDLVNDAEEFDMWYSKDNQEVRMVAKWKMGTQIAFPELVVYAKIA